MKKQKNSVLLILACVASFLAVSFSIVVLFVLLFDGFGIRTILENTLASGGYTVDEISNEITLMYFEFGLSAAINMYYGTFYLKGLKFRVNSKPFGRVVLTKGIFQAFIGSAIAGVLAIIAGAIMKDQKVVVEEKVQTDISDLKLNAMKEAVLRLKELKERGAISEEEYYANLDKILGE
jgi:hypothetical protein